MGMPHFRKWRVKRDESALCSVTDDEADGYEFTMLHEEEAEVLAQLLNEYEDRMCGAWEMSMGEDL